MRSDQPSLWNTRSGIDPAQLTCVTTTPSKNIVY